MGDEQNLVETQLLDPLQSLAGFVRGADQRDVGHLRQAGGFGSVGEVDGDIGKHGVVAAGVTASPAAQATRPNRTTNATPRISYTPRIFHKLSPPEPYAIGPRRATQFETRDAAGFWRWASGACS